VGEYAAALRGRLRAFARVQLVGEACDVRESRARVYFELRDASGAMPCAMWRRDLEALGLPPGTLVDGAQVVVGGGCDLYVGSATSSPQFSFAVSELRVAGEGDLLARLERLRRALAAEGLCDLQRVLPRRALPRSIGVVCGEGGKARDDVLAGLRRRGWAGRLVWAFAPVQDRHAAPAISRALTDLAAVDEVDVVVVARGGGSLADLLAFCDEGLCRTVALLRVPVVASVGHHTDRTLLDDVAAVSCSTPTHAAEAAVPLHVGEARVAAARGASRLARHARRVEEARARAARGGGRLARHARGTEDERREAARAAARLARHARGAEDERREAARAAARLARHAHGAEDERREAARAGARLAWHARRAAEGPASLAPVAALLARHGRRAVLDRARALTAVARAPAGQLARHRRELEQTARELRATTRRRLGEERRATSVRALVVDRKAAAGGADHARRRGSLDGLAAALAAHDPDRTLARGYALVEDRGGGVVTSAAGALAAGAVRLHFADGAVGALVDAPRARRHAQRAPGRDDEEPA